MTASSRPRRMIRRGRMVTMPMRVIQSMDWSELFTGLRSSFVDILGSFGFVFGMSRNISAKVTIVFVNSMINRFKKRKLQMYLLEPFVSVE